MFSKLAFAAGAYTNFDMAKVAMMMLSMTMITMMMMPMMVTMMMLSITMIAAGLDTGPGLCNLHSPSQQLTGEESSVSPGGEDEDHNAESRRRRRRRITMLKMILIGV